MLEYFAWDERTYFERPIPPYARPRWEFQAVLAGPLCAWTGVKPEAPRQQHLWVFPPGVRHGWSGVQGQACRVFVVHYDNVPEALRRAVASEMCLRVPLDQAKVQRLSQLAASLQQHYLQPNAASPVAEDHALLELSLLALEVEPSPSRLSRPRRAQSKARQAIVWFEERLSQGPSVAQVAAAVHVSEVHLRRIFAEAGLGPPLAVFNAMRLDRADDLLLNTDEKIATIARMLGFKGPESFHRAYRRGRGHTPGRLRQPGP